jgi:hypothetical protein
LLEKIGVQEPEEDVSQGGKEITSWYKFTGDQVLIRKACLFPSFTNIASFAIDFELQTKKKSKLSQIIKK